MMTACGEAAAGTGHTHLLHLLPVPRAASSCLSTRGHFGFTDFTLWGFAVKKQPCILSGNKKEAKSPGRKGSIVSPVKFVLGLC